MDWDPLDIKEEILDLGEPGFFEIEDTNGKIIKEFVNTEKNSSLVVCKYREHLQSVGL